MKATINEEGCLNLKPESSLEAYAIKKWFEDVDENKYHHISIESYKEV